MFMTSEAEAGCIHLRCERADPPSGARENTVQHYTPRRSTKITLNQLLLILLTIPVQLYCGALGAVGMVGTGS